MATVGGVTNEKIYSLKKWGGLNEAPDGDTRLNLGEASKMVNWKITRDGNLKRRPGTQFVAGLGSAYEIVSGPEAKIPLEEIMDDNGMITVFSGVSPDYIPGAVAPVGVGGAIIKGVFETSSADIDLGTLVYEPDNPARIVSGTLRAENAGLSYSAEELFGTLETLADGVSLYLWYDELPYAIDKYSLPEPGEGLILNAHLVKSVATQTDSVVGLWAGLVQGKEHLLAACNGWVWDLYNADTGKMIREHVKPVDTSGRVTFFPFGGDVYILDGHDYYVYNGEGCDPVPGYIPLVAITIGPVIENPYDATATYDVDDYCIYETQVYQCVTAITTPEAWTEEHWTRVKGNPSSGETTGEYINRLTTFRRVWLSPDGKRDVFSLPEAGITLEDGGYVRDLGSGRDLIGSGQDKEYEVDPTTGTITFTLYDYDVSTDTKTYHPPLKGVNTYEVCYSVETDVDYRAQVTGNRFAELFSGPTDNMVYLYGDGSNRALYSGMDYDGMPRADYFPDQYEVHAGDSNTPITSMIRHYGDLVCYKTDSTWAITQSSMELASGSDTVSIYCTPVNRDKGNVAPGQVRLVDNNPVTCSERELYHWINSSYYTSTLSRDERQARRISDRIQSSIKEIDLTKCCMWDDNDGQEFYLSQNKVTLVWNYVTDTWYRYEGIDAVCMCNFHGEVIYGTSDGLVARLTYDSLGDMGYPIKAEWESGAIDFGAANMRKYSSSMWVGLKPESGTSVDVKLITDRKDTFKEKIISSEKAKVRGQPFMAKTKLKAKKFVFYRLLLSVDDKQPAVTVTDVEFRVRQTGYAK